MVHDIGKIGIPDAILRKTGPLSREETEVMKRHPLIGEQIVSGLRTAGSLRAIIRHHHERIDGRGYPDGLAGNQIPLLARIVAVCDAFDAMVSERPYRYGYRPEHALEELRAGAGTQWDSEIVAVFGQELLPLHSRLRAS
jgi:HD-GYP domain-containing protein (c-di-GMP phosphodiesterase class II)